MMIKSKLLIALSVCMATILTGCVTAEYDKTQSKIEQVQSDIERNQGREVFQKVERINRPPIDTRPIVIEKQISWLNESIAINLDNVPLSTALKRILGNQPQVRIFYGMGVTPNKRVSLFAEGSREEVLNQLTLASNYGFVPKEERINVVRHIQKNFAIKLPTGQYSGQLGSQGKTSGDEESLRVEGQFLNVEYTNINAFEDIAKGIKEILRKDKSKTVTPENMTYGNSSGSEEYEGSVTAISSMASISVVTSPLLMEQVDEYMAFYDDALSKQVRLEAQILFFSSDSGKERGIDWNIAKDVGDGNILQFFIPGTNILSPESGYGLAFTGSGKWSGTEAFIRWLDQQGSVSSNVPVTQLALNTQPVRISQVINVPYVDTISSDATSDIISAEVVRGEKVEGIDIMVTPNIQDDEVWLRVAGKYSQIINEETKVVANEELGFLTTQDAEINFTGKLKFNQSIIIGSTSQRINTVSKKTSYSIDALGGNTTQERVIETLIVLTPRRAG